MSKIDPDLILNGHVPDPAKATVWIDGVQIAGPGLKGADWQPAPIVNVIAVAESISTARLEKLAALAAALEVAIQEVENYPANSRNLPATMRRNRSFAHSRRDNAKTRLLQAIRRLPRPIKHGEPIVGRWGINMFGKLIDCGEKEVAA